MKNIRRPSFQIDKSIRTIPWSLYSQILSKVLILLNYLTPFTLSFTQIIHSHRPRTSAFLRDLESLFFQSVRSVTYATYFISCCVFNLASDPRQTKPPWRQTPLRRPTQNSLSGTFCRWFLSAGRALVFGFLKSAPRRSVLLGSGSKGPINVRDKTLNSQLAG